MNTQNTKHNLEEANQFLRKYRNNLNRSFVPTSQRAQLIAIWADFKNSVIGFHMSDHHLQPEHEVEALAEIMEEFSQAVKKAKAGATAPRRPLEAVEQGPEPE